MYLVPFLQYYVYIRYSDANQDYDVLKSSLLNIKDYAHEYISLLEPEFLKNRERNMLESKYPL